MLPSLSELGHGPFPSAPTPNSLLLSNWTPWNNREKNKRMQSVFFATFAWMSPLSDRIKVSNNPCVTGVFHSLSRPLLSGRWRTICHFDSLHCKISTRFRQFPRVYTKDMIIYRSSIIIGLNRKTSLLWLLLKMAK